LDNPSTDIPAVVYLIFKSFFASVNKSTNYYLYISSKDKEILLSFFMLLKIYFKDLGMIP